MQYTILNNINGEVHHFTTVKLAVGYLKGLKKDISPISRDEIIDLCNLFAKYKNKFSINGVPS